MNTNLHKFLQHYTIRQHIFYKLLPFLCKNHKKHLHTSKTLPTFVATKAQMAESVDALVSNTSGATHPGSIPGLGTKRKSNLLFRFSFFTIRPLIICFMNGYPNIQVLHQNPNINSE